MQDQPRRALRNIGIFLLALLGMHLLLDVWLPSPDVGEVSEKLTFFARHRGEYDALFVGSSRVCRQIAPGVFDAEVSAATHRPMRSFNLGAPSMFLPESLFVIDRILEQKPTRLRWMFIELNEPRPRLEEHAGLMRREVYWHGWRETALVSINISRANGFRKIDRLMLLAHQWLLFGRRWMHPGRVSEWLESKFAASDPNTLAASRAASLGPSMDGYVPYRSTLGEGKGVGRGGNVDAQTFTAAANALREGRAQSKSEKTTPRLLRWLLAEKIHALRAQGIQPVFLIAPVTTGETEFLRAPDEGGVRPLLAFNDPTTYPELYNVKVRADTMHLNERGSDLFTRLIARKFVEYQTNAAP